MRSKYSVWLGAVQSKSYPLRLARSPAVRARTSRAPRFLGVSFGCWLTELCSITAHARSVAMLLS
jgi:hypothetical protein